MRLSKSLYCRGIQCPKMPWMEKNMYEVYDESVLNQARLLAGTRVGELAKWRFGPHAETAYNEDKSLMIDETQAFLASGAEIITEASFATDGDFCSVDILINSDNLVIIEVKSSAEIKPIYYHDMAYQYHVLTKCGYKVNAVYLMHINNQYVRLGELDLKELFAIEDCTKEVIAMQSGIEDSIQRIKDIAELKHEPVFDIGEYCSDPYDCGYKNHCWRHIPEHSVFSVSGLYKSKKFDLYRRGIVSFRQLLEHRVKLSENQMAQVTAEVGNLPPMIDELAIREFLETFSYPLYFLDFETYNPAIPEYDGVKPYMRIPFQYSLHILDKPGGRLEHREFLAEVGEDPRPELVRRLCADIPEDVSVLAYNMGFERGVISEIAETFPEYRGHLLRIHSNFHDLMRPFQSRAFYQREFCGSYSIKAVLPALCPDDPELDYSRLSGIHNGDEAMSAFSSLIGLSPEESEQKRRELLAYCRLDTLAMVKILERLYELMSVEMFRA